MARWEHEESLIDDGEGLEVKPIHVNHKHTAADSPQAHAGLGGDDAYARQANRDESRAAREGQHWAALNYQSAGPFSPSVGMHSQGKDHVSVFSRSIRMSGGVRQGPSWTSDSASGAARAPVNGNDLNLDVQDQGAGDTFRKRQSRRIGRKV